MTDKPAPKKKRGRPPGATQGRKYSNKSISLRPDQWKVLEAKGKKCGGKSALLREIVDEWRGKG